MVGHEMASLDNGNSEEGEVDMDGGAGLECWMKPRPRRQAQKKASLELLQVRLIGKKLAATSSPAGVQYHRRDRA